MTTRTRLVPPPAFAEPWWPLEDVARTGTPWFADHASSGWWDPGDMPRTRLRQAAALADELLASLPRDALGPGVRALELRCGPGAVLQELALRTHAELHGWDDRADLLVGARALVPEAVFYDGDAPPLDVEPGSFDVVLAPRCFAAGTLAWAELLAEAHRLLRPGGLLAAVVAGPGVWAWEGGDEPWDEGRTGFLALGFDRPDERGGPTCFTSRWWLTEHWGRGFESVLYRPCGVAMVHPDRGFGLTVWRRREGPGLNADVFAAQTPGDRREGVAVQRQLALARREACGLTDVRARVLAGLRERSAILAEAVGA